MHLNNQRDAAQSCEGLKRVLCRIVFGVLGYGLIHLINLILAIPFTYREPIPTFHFSRHQMACCHQLDQREQICQLDPIHLS
jgi:hypothetical protein